MVSLTVVSLTASLFSAAALQAQQTVLEEVIVTAQKREQSLVDVAASVSVLTGTQVSNLLGTGENIRALSGRVPSLVIESSNGRQSPRFYIRGLGNSDFDVAANQPVLMIYDEITLENAVLKSIPVWDVERIEVLKGPQGTLFGRNTTAGIVKIDSVRPSQDKSGYAMLGYGSRGTTVMEGAFGGGLTDTISARLSLKYQTRNNYIDNIVTDDPKDFGAFDELALRLQVLIEPNDNFSALFKLHAFDQEGTMPQVFYANAIAIGAPGVRDEFDYKVASHDGGSEFWLEHIGGAANLEWTFENGMTLTSITGYDELENFQRADVDGGLAGGPEVVGTLGRHFGFPIETGDAIKDHNQFSQELRLAHQVGDTFFQVGAFYFKEKVLISNTNFLTILGIPLDETFVDQKTVSKAVFGHVSHDFSDQLTLSGGLRYTKDSKDLLIFAGPGSGIPTQTVDKSDDFVNWDLALSYDVNDEWTVYGRAGNASRGPVAIGRFGFASTAETETLTSVELGFKSLLMGGRSRWSGAVYAFKADDLQLTATGGTGNTNSLLNADRVNGHGIETDLEILLSDQLRLTLNASYNFTEIDHPGLLTEECGGAPHCTGLNPIVDEFDGFFGPVTLVDIDGNALPRAPRYIFNIILDYSKPLENGGEMYINTDWNYRSNSNTLLYDSVEFLLEERWIGGLRIGFRNEQRNFDLSLVGRNITNEIVVDGVIDFLNPTVFINEPKYWGMEARFSY
jgi:iron complex outermembrane receptor protein